MRKPSWMVLVVSEHDQSQVKQIRVTRELMRATIASALLGLSLLFSLGASYVLSGGKDVRVERLQKRNQLLQSEVLEIRGEVKSLEGTIAELSAKDREYRLLAGLEPEGPALHFAALTGTPLTPDKDPLWAVDRRVGRMTFTTSSELGKLVHRARALSDSWDEATWTLGRKYAELEATPSILPAHGVLTSNFTKSRWHPILHRARPHEGIDITAPTGTPIVAAASGRVIKAERDGDFGLMVEIDHGFGYVTRYAHASRLKVRRGDEVERGQMIAAVGTTGLTVGPHLHYEVLVDGKPVNPVRYILAADVIKD